MASSKVFTKTSFEATGAVLPPKPSVYRSVSINLEDIEEETRCAVCLGVIKDARLIAQCMHRFCAVCIEKWLRQSKQNDCPQCRKPMQSRRDCKSDPRFDRLVALLFNDVEEYEKQQVDQEALDKAFQLGAKLSRLQEHRKAAMPRVKRGPLSSARSGSATPTWSASLPMPAAASENTTSSRAASSPRASSHGQQAHLSHKRGAARKSRHGRQEALHVPLEDDDSDVSGLAQLLTQQAQKDVSTTAAVVLQLVPDPKAKGLLPLKHPFVTAPASTTVYELALVLAQLHSAMSPSPRTFSLGPLSPLKNQGRFALHLLAANPNLQSDVRNKLDPSTNLIELSAARQDAFAPLLLMYWLEK